MHKKMRIYVLPFVCLVQLLATSVQASAPSNNTPAECLLEIPVHGVSPPSTSLDDDPESALDSFATDFEFGSRAAPLHFLSYAISGAAAVYVNSVGLVKGSDATDILGREITIQERMLLSPDQWVQVLRAANLQLSVVLAQMNTSKVLVVVNLQKDAEALASAFSPERRGDTFLRILAWSRQPQVSEELRFFLSRVEALVLLDAPYPLAESSFMLESLVYYATLFSEGRGDIKDVMLDVQLLSPHSFTCSPPGFPSDTPETSTECSRVSDAASKRRELYHQLLDGRQAPRLHVSPLGDAYYLKRFISPPDMPSFYLPHSRRTLEASIEQRHMLRFLASCLAHSFTSKQLRYANASKRSGVAEALEADLGTMKAVFAADTQP